MDFYSAGLQSKVDMLLHSDTLSLFRTNQYLLSYSFYIAGLADKQQIPKT